MIPAQHLAITITATATTTLRMRGVSTRVSVRYNNFPESSPEVVPADSPAGTCFYKMGKSSPILKI